jgi:hypothetical protein
MDLTCAANGARTMPWDPFGPWPAARRWLWAGLACGLCLFQGPTFVRKLWPGDLAPDFFQEWASARFLLNGQPIYTDLRVAIERYLGGPAEVKMYVEVNAHPPTSVLLAVPFAVLDFPDAAFAWNLLSLAALGVSLWLMGRQLGVPMTIWSVFPAIVILLLCNALWQQVMLAQLNLVLLLMITGLWAADRSGRWRTAGILLGAATAIKLFPGFLFVYFALRRQWWVVVAGVVSLAVLTALTALILGPDTYRTYVLDVMPRVEVFQSRWGNASLIGFWRKLFDPVATDQETIVPLWRSPPAFRAGALLSCLALIAVLVPVVWRAGTRRQCDAAFGLAVTAMLLVSPITWSHAFLLLLLPLAMVWLWLPSTGLVLWLFLSVVVALWLDPLWLWEHFIPGGYPHGIATPAHTLTVLSFQCYALVGLFALGVRVSREPPPGTESHTLQIGEEASAVPGGAGH